MKKMISYALFASLALFASCSQDETLEQATNAPGVLSFTTNLPTEGAQTKAADANVQRYIMQLYADYEGQMTAQYLNPDGADDTAQKLLIQADGNFTIDGAAINLTEGATYTAVFWADYDAPTTASTETTYNANYLNCVQLNDGKEMAMAYCGTSEFTYGSDMQPSYNVTLTRAVAQVNLNQTEAFTATEGDQLTASYSRYFVYNALEESVYPSTESWQTYVPVTTALNITAGDVAANATLGNILVFASADESINTDFSFSYGGTVVGSVTQVPLQANYQTNISGNYHPSFSTTTSFNVTTDDTWNSTPHSGDLTPGTGDGGEEATEDTTKPIIGTIVVTTEGLNINYTIPVTDETSLEGGKVDIYLYNSAWEPVGELTSVYFQAGSTTEATVTGSLTVDAADTYHIGVYAYDAAGNKSEYKDYQNITVTQQ